MKELLAEYRELLESAPQVVVGYSGGLDSTLLLHAVNQLQLPGDLLAVHVNHQLQSTSDDWESKCRDQAAGLGIPFYSERVETSSESAVEESARRLRYEVLSRSLHKDGVLLLAHHADDQIETVLFRLFRGAGLRGLRGMPERRAFGEGLLLRPFIKRSKKELTKIAKLANISWIEDPSNQYNEYDRNYIRNELIPVISRRFPAAPDNIIASSSHLSEASILAKDVADQDLRSYGFRQESVGESIELDELRNANVARQKNALSNWVLRHVGIQLNQKLYKSLVKTLFDASEDAMPLVQLEGAEFRRYKNRLYLLPTMPMLEAKSSSTTRWDISQGVMEIEGLWRLISVSSQSNELVVSTRAGGERMLPFDRDHSQTLKKLFSEYEVEPWLRAYLPVIRDQGQIVGVGDRIFAKNYRFELQWLIEPPSRFR